MNINNESQFELFPGTSRNSQENGKKRSLLTSLSFSMDNVVVLCIVIIMAMILSYSLGVERGKSFGYSQIKFRLKNHQLLDKNISSESSGIEAQMADTVPAREARGDLQIQSDEENLDPVQKAIELPENAYTIQVASFKLEKTAQREAEQLRKKGYDIYVLPKGSHSIVCVGKFAQKNEAKLFISKLKKRYKDCLVRRL